MGLFRPFPPGWTIPSKSPIVSLRVIQAMNDSKVLSFCVVLDATVFFKYGRLDGLLSMQCRESVNILADPGSGRPVNYWYNQVRPDPAPRKRPIKH